MFIDYNWDKTNKIYNTADSNIGIWRNQGKNYILNLTTFEYHEASGKEIESVNPEKSFYKGWLLD